MKRTIECRELIQQKEIKMKSKWFKNRPFQSQVSESFQVAHFLIFEYRAVFCDSLSVISTLIS